MTTNTQLIDAIDACLPQTQCRQCLYPGCRPYAAAIVNQGVAIDHCLPGGVKVLQEIANIMDVDPAPLIEDMQKKAKPPAVVAIREQECIGCTKCILACPVDAIIGAAKLMHTVVNDICTGCELCIPACPVDCIDLVAIAEREPGQQQEFAASSRSRYHQHNARLSEQRERQQHAHDFAKLQQNNQQQTLDARQAVIHAAVLRAQKKKARQAEDKKT